MNTSRPPIVEDSNANDILTMDVPESQHGRTGRHRWLDPDPRKLLHHGSLVLLVCWCAWWGSSLAKQNLHGVTLTNQRAWFGSDFGKDFIWHIDKPTRVWLSGGDPYGDKSRMCCYPPLVMPMFSWVGVMTPPQALTVWICMIALMAVGGSIAAWRCRKQLKLNAIPLSAIVAAVLFSTPVLFAMDRGQYDIVMIPIVMAALFFMKRESWKSQFISGAILALAPWAKVYPILLGIGLVGLRRWNAAAGFAVAGLLLLVAIPGMTGRFLENNDLHMAQAKALSAWESPTRVHVWNHSLSDNWPRIWNEGPLRFLSQVDGYVATAVILGSMLLWVSWRMFQCRQRQRLAFPYLIWIVAVAAFVPPVANDYSLVFMPIAILCVCGRRDPLLGRLAILALVFWWQPFFLPINGRVLLLIKLVALAATGLSITERARELSEAELSVADSEHDTPSQPHLLAS